MEITLWGVRGSLPSPHSSQALEDKSRTLLNLFFKQGHTEAAQIEHFLRSTPSYLIRGWGGNTPCIQVKSEKGGFLIDGGTGIRQYGYELMKGSASKGEAEIHLFFTHFHWDHLIGLPFFAPLFVPGNVIHIYAVQEDVLNVFPTLFKKPFFPVPLEHIGAQLVYHKLEPRQPHRHLDFTLTPYQLDHPDPCWGYRIEQGGKAYAHCVDTECTRVSRAALGLDLPLYQDIDLMVFDAQYTTRQKFERSNWGHASAAVGLDLAMREKIKKVIFMHNDPAAMDEDIAKVESEAKLYYDLQIQNLSMLGKDVHQLDWSFATEGMTIAL